MYPDRSREGNRSHKLTSKRPTKNSNYVAAEVRQIGKNSTKVHPGVRLSMLIPAF